MGAVGIVSRRRGVAFAALGATALVLLAVGGHRPTDPPAPATGPTIETVAGYARPSFTALPLAHRAGIARRAAPARDRLPIVPPSGVAATDGAGWAAALVIVGAVLLGRRPTSGLRSRAPPVALV